MPGSVPKYVEKSSVLFYIYLMKNRLNFSHGSVALLIFTSLACEQTYPPLAATEVVKVPYAIVSVEQAVSATQAIIELKLPNVGVG